MGRRCKTLVPEADTLLKPRYSTEEETRALTGSKQRQQHQYNHHAKPVYSRPLPSEKNRRRGVCGGGGRLYRPVHGLVSDGQSISSSSVKTANNKMPVSSVFNDSEGLYRTTVSVALSVILIIPRGKCVSGHVYERVFFLRYATGIPRPRLRGKTTYRD